MLPEPERFRSSAVPEGEKLTPLDISEVPGRPLRDVLPPEAVSEDLDDLAAGQKSDGGWEVDFARGGR